MSPNELRRKTEERVANAGGATTISTGAARWGEVQKGQYGETEDTYAWSGVPLDGFGGREKGG